MSKRLRFEVLSKVSINSENRNDFDNQDSLATTSKFFKDTSSTKFQHNNILEDNIGNLKSVPKELNSINSSNAKFSVKQRNNKNCNQPHRNLNIWRPANWEDHLCNIRKMRENCTAPVDTMGCNQCIDKLANGRIFRFQSLVSLMLSSQTKDKLTYEAMQRLKEVNCSPESIASISDEALGKLIYPVSFWKRKVQYLKKTSNILIEKFKSDIPDNVNDLCSLPGVGPKMAHICMQVAWNKVSGIGVDTHVHRICNRLKWVRMLTKTPEETRNEVEAWLPKALWGEINQLFVGFGQEICQSQNPKCLNCLNINVCPFVENKYQF